MKPYCKNEKPFVYAVFSDQDKEKALPIMRKLADEGVLFWFTERFSKKERKRMEAAYSCVVFISNHSIHDENTKRCIEYAVSYNKQLLCIYLEKTTLSPGLELMLNAMQAMDQSVYPDDQEFYEKLRSAEVFSGMGITPAQKRFAKRRAMVSVLIPVASAIVIFFTVVYPLLIAPAILAANGSMSKVGFGNMSLEELAEVEELWVVGRQPVNRYYYAAYMTDRNGDEDRTSVYSDFGVIPAGDISDISDLVLLKSAKCIAFEANQISDITPLYQLHTLEQLTLNCNPIKSIEGIEALQNLQQIDLAFTEVSDITPLFGIPRLENISVRNTFVSSLEGVENLTRLRALSLGFSNITDISPLRTMDFSYIRNTDGFSFDAEGLHIEDYSPLEQIPKFSNIAVSGRGLENIVPYLKNKQVLLIYAANSSIQNLRLLSSIQNMHTLALVSNRRLTSLDGIEEHDRLTNISLINCSNINDYTPLLKLPKLKQLIITSEMKQRALSQLEAADFEIIIEGEEE